MCWKSNLQLCLNPYLIKVLDKARTEVVWISLPANAWQLVRNMGLNWCVNVEWFKQKLDLVSCGAFEICSAKIKRYKMWCENVKALGLFVDNKSERQDTPYISLVLINWVTPKISVLNMSIEFDCIRVFAYQRYLFHNLKVSKGKSIFSYKRIMWQRKKSKPIKFRYTHERVRRKKLFMIWKSNKKMNFYANRFHFSPFKVAWHFPILPSILFRG